LRKSEKKIKTSEVQKDLQNTRELCKAFPVFVQSFPLQMEIPLGGFPQHPRRKEKWLLPDTTLQM
jgi:hypothetical protein